MWRSSKTACSPSRDAAVLRGAFDKGLIPQLRIEVAPDELQKLRQNNRAYVWCSIREDDKINSPDVALKMKGAAGSFREFDDKPAIAREEARLFPKTGILVVETGSGSESRKTSLAEANQKSFCSSPPAVLCPVRECID